MGEQLWRIIYLFIDIVEQSVTLTTNCSPHVSLLSTFGDLELITEVAVR